MKNIRSFFCLALLAGLLGSFSLAGCSTGTNPGDTNVERGHVKDKDAKAGTDKEGQGHRDNEPGADR